MQEKLPRNAPKETKKTNRKPRASKKKEETDMPYYQWQDTNTKKTLDVARKMSEIDIAPDKDECLEEGFTVEEFAEAEWTREISTVQFLGEKGKGNWGRK